MADQVSLEELQRKAEAGDADVQLHLGVMYWKGKDVEQNNAEAVKWFRKAADQGDSQAQYALGVMYAKGEGVPQDDTEAAKWYRKAGDQGHSQAQYALGVMHSEGKGVPQDDDEAVKWFRKAADTGSASAQFKLGQMYSQGKGVPKDGLEAVEWYRKALDQGVTGAQPRIKELEKEARLGKQSEWTKLAERGDADAQYELGKLAHEDLNDYVQAAKWFLKAAEQGNSAAQLRTGLMYMDGQGVSKDVKVSERWLRKAADSGSSEATLRLAEAFDFGFFGTEDQQEALRLYRKVAEDTASDNDHTSIARQAIAYFYMTGLGGLGQDTDKAIEIYSSPSGGDAVQEKDGHVELMVGAIYYSRATRRRRSKGARVLNQGEGAQWFWVPDSLDDKYYGVGHGDVIVKDGEVIDFNYLDSDDEVMDEPNDSMDTRAGEILVELEDGSTRYRANFSQNRIWVLPLLEDGSVGEIDHDDQTAMDWILRAKVYGNDRADVLGKFYTNLMPPAHDDVEEIDEIPKGDWSNRAFVLKATKDEPWALGYASEELQADREVVLEVVKEDGSALEYASDELRADREVVLVAVNNDERALEYASKELRSDRKVVLAAVKRSGSVLKYASEELRADREVFLEVVRNIHWIGDALRYASEALRADREVVLEAVKSNGLALTYASKELRSDRKVVLAAVKNDGRALKYSSEKLRTDREVVLEAVKQYGEALEYASEELRADREVVLEAVRNGHGALAYASEVLRGDRAEHDFIIELMSIDGALLANSKFEVHRNQKDVVLAAVGNKGLILEYASEELRNDREVVQQAIRSNHKALQFASPELQQELKNAEPLPLDATTAESSRNLKGFVLDQVSQHGGRLEHASEELKADREIALAAVKAPGNGFRYVADELRADKEIALEAVSRSVEMFEYVASSLQSDEELLALVADKKPTLLGQLGADYEHGAEVEKNPELAFKLTLAAAEAGDDMSYFKLAEYYETGFGTEADKQKALHWYKQAAQLDDEEAADKVKELSH